MLPRLEVIHHQLTRCGVVGAADTDGTEQDRHFRMPGDITADPSPKKKQGSKLALILSHDKRTAQLQRRSEPVEKIRLIMKECARVQSSRASFGDNLRTSPHAICPGDSLLPLIPKNDMAII